MRLRPILLLLILTPLLGGCSLLGPLMGTAQSLLPLAAAKFTLQCLPEGVMIDTPEGPRPVESLRAGDRVIGYEGHPVRILMVHEYSEDPTNGRFLRLSFADGREVDLCRMHRVAGTRALEWKPGDMVAGHRLTSVAPYRGVIRSYDLLTEDDGYRISGVPVNSMIEEMIQYARDGQLRDAPEEL